MGSAYDHIDDRIAEFVSSQPVFFVASAPLAGGHVNCSPKGNRNEFAVLGPRSVAYLDQTGSGSETIAHLRENGRIVIMFCSFSGPPRIIRFHGTGRCIPIDDPKYRELASQFSPPSHVGARSVITVEVERISDSCGYGVPLMAFEGHRPTMDQWSMRKGLRGIREYWQEKNTASIDGLPSLDLERSDPI